MAKNYSGFAKVTYLIGFSQTFYPPFIQHTSIAHLHSRHFLCIITFYYVHLFLENSSIFSHYIFTDIFGITYSKKSQSLKTSTESFLVILAVFLYLLRAVQPFLIKFCKDVFCIAPILNALKKFIQQVLLSSPFHFGVFFWSDLWYFSLFFENRLVSHEILHIYSW